MVDMTGARDRIYYDAIKRRRPAGTTARSSAVAGSVYVAVATVRAADQSHGGAS